MTIEEEVVHPPYEFTDRENGVLRSLAMRAKIWGAVSAFGGFLCLILAGVSAAVTTRAGARPQVSLFVFAAIPQLSMGISFLGASRQLSKVVDTNGNDVELFVHAVRHMTAALRVQVAVTVLFILTVAMAAASVYLIES